MEISVRALPLSFHGFVKSLDNTSTLSITTPSEPSPSSSLSPTAPPTLLRRLKARASALSLRKAAVAATPACTNNSRVPSRTHSPPPSLRHTHSCSDISPSFSRARSPSLFSCTSARSKNRSLCSKRSIELSAISNPSSSLSDLLEEAFEKPRRAPRPPIPAAFMLEVVDDYKMECPPESHFNCEEGASTDSGFIDSTPPPVPPKPSRNPHNLTIIPPSTIASSLSPSHLTTNGAPSPLTPNGEIDCKTDRLSTNLSPYGQNWSPLLQVPLPSATSTTLASARSTMFFPLPPATNSTSLPTSPSPSSPGGFASIARKVSHLASGGAKQKPLPLPLHPPPTDAVDEHGKESGSGKKGRLLTLWGRLSGSPTTPKSSATPSPKETSFTHSPVLPMPVLQLPSPSSPSPQWSCVSLVFSDDERSAAHSPSTPLDIHFVGGRMSHPYSSRDEDGKRSEDRVFEDKDDEGGCDGDHEGDGDDEPREEEAEEEETESETSTLPSPCMGVELELDIPPPPYISTHTYPDSDTDPSLSLIPRRTAERPGPSAGRARKVGFVTPPPTHPPPFVPLPPAPSGDWTLGFGGAPASSFSFSSSQQAMEEVKARQLKKGERDWTLGLDLIVGAGLLMKAPKGVEEEVKMEKRSGSPYPMLSVESSRGRALSHSSVNKAVSPTSVVSRRIDIRPGAVPLKNSFVGGFSSDSSARGGEEDDEWSDRSEWPTAFHRRSRLPSLSSVKSG